MKRSIQVLTIFIVITVFAMLVMKYRTPRLLLTKTAVKGIDSVTTSRIAAALPTSNGSVAIATDPTSQASSGIENKRRDDELEPFLKPRYATPVKYYNEDFAAFSRLDYHPIRETDRVDDVAALLTPVLDNLLSLDARGISLMTKYGSDARTSLNNHLAIMLLRFSGLDAATYLNLISQARRNRLYMPAAIAQYQRACDMLLPATPPVRSDSDQVGLRQVFDALSALQSQGPAAANNKVTGWSSDAGNIQLKLAERKFDDDASDDAMSRLVQEGDLQRRYFGGGFQLGCMIFTTDKPATSAEEFVAMFRAVVRTAEDFYTVRIISSYDVGRHVWHLQEAARCVSPRVAAANPMVF